MMSVEGDKDVNDNGDIKETEPILRISGKYVTFVTPPHDSQPTPQPLWYWVKLGVAVLCLIVLGLVIFNWVGPYFIQKVVIPVINWQRHTFTSTQLAIIVFASIALFPTILLPSSPSMWLAGITFGYFYGFFLVMSAAIVGVSLPFFIGSIFHHKIEEWLEKYPEKASVLRSAGAGNWFHQFRAVALIRISPFPYMMYNYCSVVTKVPYGPYLCGSLVGMMPEVVATIYTGILIRALANVSHKTHRVSAPQIVLSVVGFCIAVSTTILIIIYSKRRLDDMRKEGELLLNNEYGSQCID